ncbi:hypothetical protein [Streptomyces sp. NBC_01235]|nr:hypothetical protein OG289_00715 [Streptomyces sp. NBC_01235]
MSADRQGCVIWLPIDNGDLNSYWRFHAAGEHVRLCPAPDQQDYDLTA